MMQKNIMLQIFTGGYLENNVTYNAIEEKICPLLQTGKIKGILIGWSIKTQVYEKVIQLVHSYDAECYLWLPVFSENGLLEKAEMLRDDTGNQVRSYALKEGENFEFYCPNQRNSKENVRHIYEKHFEKYTFDGLFLDKIRYGSFANGISGVFNCFCPACEKAYAKAGIDPAQLQAEMKKVREQREEYQKSPLGITGYVDGSYEFANPLWKQFFTWKSEQITKALEEIISYFRGKNMKIGVDTLSPFMAEFVGQDYKKLKGMVDFVKPMMYGITNAPAGLPFEYANLLQKTVPDGGENVRNIMNHILSIQNDSTTRMDKDFVREEVRIVCDHEIPVMCGIEINRIPGIVDVTPTYIQETMQELSKTQISGFVLAWDILSAPEENIEMLKNMIGKEN
ncbi:MAG: hypothetical protein PHE02_11095 [Lachnospiraceae bacterium]|nr:hypothetical protein [Lachnospiraceae bacterium]